MMVLFEASFERMRMACDSCSWVISVSFTRRGAMAPACFYTSGGAICCLLAVSLIWTLMGLLILKSINYGNADATFS